MVRNFFSIVISSIRGSTLVHPSIHPSIQPKGNYEKHRMTETRENQRNSFEIYENRRHHVVERVSRKRRYAPSIHPLLVSVLLLFLLSSTSLLLLLLLLSLSLSLLLSSSSSSSLVSPNSKTEKGGKKDLRAMVVEIYENIFTRVKKYLRFGKDIYLSNKLNLTDSQFSDVTV